MENTYFDHESYEHDIALEVNEDVLTRIYSDGVKPTDSLSIEFYFLTDTESKATNFLKHLALKFPAYHSLAVNDYDADFEISGSTDPIQMSLQLINEWNKLMWDFGYVHDCRLDGWQVGT